ncbi:MAG: hypothetical protein GF399_10420 [Candidatus Coatesbacteria bacterium]|nr:hypothetical protein [Candidatus Coatesbacteria bacterium]
MQVVLNEPKKGRGHLVVPDGVGRFLSSKGVKCAPLEYETYRGQDLNGCSILISRYGGGGDLLFITAVTAELRRRFPSAQITVACGANWSPLFATNRDVNRFVRYPFTLELLNAHDYYLTFEGLIEGSSTGEPSRRNVYDLFFDHCGLDPSMITPESKRPCWKPAPGDLKKSRRLYDQLTATTSRGVIGLQWRTSSILRTYPPRRLAELCQQLVAEGYQVLLLGRPRELPRGPLPAGILRIGRQPITVLMALLPRLELLVAPDSFFTHAAAAQNVPTVALYGPFSADSRTKYYPRCRTLEVSSDCAPCFKHGHRPCTDNLNGYSRCWYNLSVEEIFTTCKEVLNDEARD